VLHDARLHRSDFLITRSLEVLKPRERADRAGVGRCSGRLATSSTLAGKGAARRQERDDAKRRKYNQPLPHVRFPLPLWLLAAVHRSRLDGRTLVRSGRSVNGRLEACRPDGQVRSRTGRVSPPVRGEGNGRTQAGPTGVGFCPPRACPACRLRRRLDNKEMHRAVASSSGNPTDLRLRACHSGSHQPQKLRTRCGRDTTRYREGMSRASTHEACEGDCPHAVDDGSSEEPVPGRSGVTVASTQPFGQGLGRVQVCRYHDSPPLPPLWRRTGL
jgi:hypothetical protein